MKNKTFDAYNLEFTEIDFVKLNMIESLKSIFKKGFNNLPFYLKDFSQNYFNYYRARIFFNMIIIIKIILN